MDHPLRPEDLLYIAKDDKAEVLLHKLEVSYRESRSFFIFPRLMIALFKMSWVDVALVSIYTVVEGVTRVVMPVILIFLLRSLQNLSTPARQAYEWAAILGGVGIIQTIIHHVLFYISMRLGWNWKTACLALIHRQLFRLKGSTLQQSGSGTGKLVNLISNDVARFEEFAIVRNWIFKILFDAVCLILMLL